MRETWEEEVTNKAIKDNQKTGMKSVNGDSTVVPRLTELLDNSN